MKVIIAGSRKIPDAIAKLAIVKIWHSNKLVITEIVSGMAPGVDRVGLSLARETGTPAKRFPAKWTDLDAPGAVIKHGKFGPYNARAGHDRNQLMADYADLLIAVWDGRSTGTADMIARAQAKGIPVYVAVVSGTSEVRYADLSAASEWPRLKHLLMDE